MAKVDEKKVHRTTQVRLLDEDGEEIRCISHHKATRLIKGKIAKCVKEKPYTVQLVRMEHNTELLLCIYQTVRYIKITKESVHRINKALTQNTGKSDVTLNELMRIGKMTDVESYKGEYSMREQIRYLHGVVECVDACLEKLKANPKTAASYETLTRYYLTEQYLKPRIMPDLNNADNEANETQKELKKAIEDLDKLLWNYTAE